MATEKRYGYNNYVYGSTAKQLNNAPLREEHQKRILTPTRDTKKNSANHQMQSLDVFSLLFMTAALVVTLYFCISYIQIQHDITTMSKQIANKESEINDLRNQNDAAYNRIDASVDLSYIYNVAVNKLGMVHVDQENVMTYSNVKSDLVRQYSEIPEEETGILKRTITKDKK